MGHAETLFFVHHDQSQIMEIHILLEQPVRADHNIDRSGFQFRNDLPLFRFAPEPAQSLDDDRILGKTFEEIVIMLLRQDGGRDQNGGLPSGHYAFEDRPHGDFGFAVADVAAEQPVHRPRRFHILFDLLRRAELIGGFGVGK